ncbi:hypothetical protein CKAH01_00876 [Colletotrichum kahawae]|uniref:Uncharacterized protein n=1 Tax=Colletotrichum kahawae TaxID=34407 RepID=A0AAE0D7J6_COLKA|nr:hypothetical protein CKAH01_00876 [Colletotrichum kahawae]
MMSEKGPSSGSSNNPCLINPMDLTSSRPLRRPRPTGCVMDIVLGKR